jgi:ERCC4-type nuclease
MNEVITGAGVYRRHSHLPNLLGAAAIIKTMSETAQAKRERRVVPSKRKSALPVKKAKRKIVQASRKRNR